jgi:NADH-quinone oxidoreductase subunit H
MIWVRWTLPRLRIDQVMKTCLKYCTPIAAVMFVGAVGWKYQFPDGLFLKRAPGHVREAHFSVGEQQVEGRKQKTAASESVSPLAKASTSIGGESQ